MGLTSKEWAPLINRLRSEAGFTESEAEFLLIEKIGGWYSHPSAEQLAVHVRSRIDQHWEKSGGFDDVVLAGHSIGGLLVRRAFVSAAGSDTLDPTASEWAQRVSRIVLLAAANRGVAPRRALHRFVAWFLRLFPHPHMLVEDALLGSTFVTNLRIEWIRHYGREGTDVPKPPVVQLLGEHDDIVTKEDSQDLKAFPGGRYPIVPDARHDDLHRLDTARDPEGRYAMLRTVFVDPIDTMPGRQIHAADDVRRVVIVLHGIRASNNDQWVKLVRNSIEALGDTATVVITPTYGYFNALRFALPGVRRRNIRNLQDEYTEMLAKHPRATFSFVGHSNGTYMLGQSLLSVPAMRFENVVLAGSVLPTSYPWQDLQERRQVVRILNERANRDWPVALLCSALNGLMMKDVGRGGFLGFNGDTTYEVAYHVGGHGAALMEPNIGRLAAFALSGSSTPIDLPNEPGYYLQLSNAAPFLIRILLLLVVALTALALARDGRVSLSEAMAVVGVLAGLYIVLSTI